MAQKIFCTCHTRWQGFQDNYPDLAFHLILLRNKPARGTLSGAPVTPASLPGRGNRLPS
ncbi:MAG: hypothetical protein ACE5IR_05495 [bacterium]